MEPGPFGAREEGKDSFFFLFPAVSVCRDRRVLSEDVSCGLFLKILLFFFVLFVSVRRAFGK